MALLKKLGYKAMGYIPSMESQAFGKWTTPATEAEIAQAVNRNKTIMDIQRINTYDDNRFSQTVLHQHGCFL